MSVYKRPGAQTYSYDFEFRGDRFSGDTEKASKREALGVQKLKKEEARQQAATADAIDAPNTWELASSRYWTEVGQYHKNSDTTAWCLAWLTRAIGRQTPLVDIDDNRVAALVAKRRNEFRQVGKPESRTKKVGPATVNRTVTEPLRKVMLRAARVWKVKVGEVSWGQHMLTEPRERVREASSGEEIAIMGELERGYEDAVAFAFATGCRRMEIVGLVWTRVDFFGRQFTVLGKGNKLRTIPMSDAVFDLLWRQQGNHAESVFTFLAARTRREYRQIRGQRYPITEHGLRSAMRRAIPDAGVENFRFHDTRHTAATRLLRVSNIKVVKTILGHEDIATTDKYAHALDEDLRAALNAATPTKNPTAEGSGEGKDLAGKGKTG